MQVDTRMFFKCGMVAFSVIGLSSIANFFIFYSQNNFFSNLTAGAYIFFYIILVAYFAYMLKTIPSSQGFKDSTAEDIVKAIKKHEGKK